MAEVSDRLIPFSELETLPGGEVVLEAAGHVCDLEVAGALLTRVMHQNGERMADAPVEAVSVAISVTGDLSGHGPMRFQTTLERRTRTLIFLKGEAWRGKRRVMLADSVFRILQMSAK